MNWLWLGLLAFGGLAACGATTAAKPPSAPPCAPGCGLPAPAPTHCGLKLDPPCQWPGPTNTGVPAGHTLTSPVSNSPDYRWDGTTMRVTKAGAHIEGLEFTGRIVVTARATMRYIRVRSAPGSKAGNVVLVDYTKSSAYLTLEDSEVDGGNDSGCSELVDYGHFTLERDNLHSCEDGTHPNGNAEIRDSWIHDLNGCCGNHNDDIQMTEGTNVTIEHNRLDNSNGENSTVLIGADQRPIANVVIADNLLNGGGFEFMAGNPARVSNITFRDNHFLRAPELGAFFSRGGASGPVSAMSHDGWVGNLWDDTGAPVA